MKNIQKLLGIIGVSLFITSPALAIPASDFVFYRGDSNPTNFHTTTYGNGLTGNNAAAFQQFVNTEALALDLSAINARKLDSSKGNIA